MVFESRAPRDQGTTDPDDVWFQFIEDAGDVWYMTEWFGSQYEDAWLNIREDDLVNLDDNR